MRFLIALMLLCVPVIGNAFRISRISPTDRCVYVQLTFAGNHYFLQRKTRTEIPIRWHGDETQNEMEFVDQVFTSAKRARRERAKESMSEQLFGDWTYRGCMS